MAVGTLEQRRRGGLKVGAAILTTYLRLNCLNIQEGPLGRGALKHHTKGETQGLGIHPGQAANTHSDSMHAGGSCLGRLRQDLFQGCGGYAHFVHGRASWHSAHSCRATKRRAVPAKALPTRIFHKAWRDKAPAQRDDTAMEPRPAAFSCPLPLKHVSEIQTAHGGGGKMTQELIDTVFKPAFSNPLLAQAHDGAVFLPPAGRRLAMSTDGHVVSPLFFPGGSIGSLAVHGTANDLAMCGARPAWLSASFILEEGLKIETLKKVVADLAEAAHNCGMQVVAGDTKVVERGRCDGLYIATTGIGIVETELDICPASVRVGDAIILSGDLGRHGMAIMAQREGIDFETALESDSAPLWPRVEALLDGGIVPHCLRDLTRGGLTTAILEIAEAAGLGALLEEAAIPVSEEVRGACELLGLDPMQVANEGRMIVIVAPEDAEAACKLLNHFEGPHPAAVIGHLRERSSSGVGLRSVVGVERILDRPTGEQLPRIC